MGSGVNQFFKGLLESRINGKSIYDYLSKSELYDEFKYTIVQKVRFDKMYMFSKYLENDGMFNQTFYDDLGDFNRTENNMTIEPKDEGYFELFYDEVICKSHIEDERERYLALEKYGGIYDDWGKIGFWFEDYDFNQQNNKKQRLKFSSSFVEKFLKTNPIGFLNDNREGFNLEGTEKYFTVRIYDMDKKVFPELFQTLRVGLNQVPANFPPLTARWIYEKYLGDLPSQKKYKVWDPCAGWGGRLLGSLCSNVPIHYIGTEVNGKNGHGYDELEHFYKRCFYEERKQAYRYDKEHHITEEGNVIGLDDGNTQEVWFEGSETIHEHGAFWDKHENTIDLVFTSPPHYDREQYSEDDEQSYLKFPRYEDWVDGYLEQTLQNAYDLLKVDRYCIINISDIKVGKDIIPLEQDTIRRALKVGFDYIGKMGMCMNRMIGLNPSNSKNYYLDTETYTTYKTEPILVFFKGAKHHWQEDDVDELIEGISSE